MLGKLIKNEFVNRWSKTMVTLAGILFISVVEAILLEINDSVLSNNSYFSIFVWIFSVVYFMAMVGGFTSMIYASFNDFAKRFFDNQGYLTHTLPVKTSKIIFSRMICDIAVMVATVLVFPLAICISMRDFSFYESIYKELERFALLSGNVIDKSLIVVIIIEIMVSFFLWGLFVLWMLNTSYSIGHMFKNKKLASVFSFLTIGALFAILNVILIMILDNININSIVIKIFGTSATGRISFAAVLMFVINLLSVLGVAILACITNWICKNKLNLE